MEKIVGTSMAAKVGPYSTALEWYKGLEVVLSHLCRMLLYNI